MLADIHIYLSHWRVLQGLFQFGHTCYKVGDLEFQGLLHLIRGSYHLFKLAEHLHRVFDPLLLSPLRELILFNFGIFLFLPNYSLFLWLFFLFALNSLLAPLLSSLIFFFIHDPVCFELVSQLRVFLPAHDVMQAGEHLPEAISHVVHYVFPIGKIF